MLEKTYVDDNGVTRLVVVRDEYDDPEMGIPLDVYDTLAGHYADAPQSFRTALFNRLYDVGLIKPDDFSRPTARTDYRRALLRTLASDATDAIRLVEEYHSNGKQHN